jgi:hypothetical protein
LRIETRRRLVEKEQLGIADERAGEREPLLLASAQLAHACAALLVELDHADHVVDVAAACVEAAEQPHRLLDGQLLGELRLLELDAEPLAESALVAIPPLAQHLDHPFVRSGQSFADLDRRGLSRAVGAEQPEALPRSDGEVEAVHGDHVTEALSQAGDAQRRLSRRGAHGEPARGQIDRPIRESYGVESRGVSAVVSRGVSAAESRGVSVRIGWPSNQSRPSLKHSRTPSSPAASRSRK